MTSLRSFGLRFAMFLLVGLCPATVQLRAQGGPATDGIEFYRAIKRFNLSGTAAVVDNVTLKRDRVEMTFSGTFYFQAPINGRVYGAVFLGRGTFRAEPPKSEFEQQNVRRMLKADVVESDFETAVLRFSDDTFDLIGKGASSQQAPPHAVNLAQEFDAHMLKETGANISARLALSVLNQENPGFFMAQFDKGRRDRFTFLLDYQCRVPVAAFGINAGEKGLVFAYRKNLFGNDIWMAFYSLQDYQRGRVEYSDAYDLISIRHYQMDADVRQPTKVFRLKSRMDIQMLAVGRVVPFTLNESLSEFEDRRLKKALRVKSAVYGDGSPASVVQEDWEIGLTVFLPAPRAAKQEFTLALEVEGDALYDSPFIPECFYPISSQGWYPTHGYLQRSTFDITFRHRKAHRVVSSGVRVREEVSPEDKSEMFTQWKMNAPIALIGFGVGQLELHAETRKLKDGSELSVEFYSLPGSILAIKEDFILAELGNTVDYFGAIFGRYPYPRFGAVYHPRGYGQGLATMLLLPRSDRASKYTYSFIAHETSHQWWGNIVAWRSYRDQWLSEGFAEYSGILYTGFRDNKGSERDLLKDTRELLAYPPVTELGIGKGRLTDVGPIILGHRLNTRETFGAYTALIYNKGALVLRMLHFLFTDPQTGDGQAFFDMMSDFVRRHQNGSASTEDFIEVANEHFARTPVARRFNVQDLNWFFRQYVYSTELPSYTFTYHIEPQPDGSAILNGMLEQSGVPEGWFMPLPLVLKYGKDKFARGLVAAYGPKATVNIKIPGKPDDVQLDPELWVLSEKTVTHK